MLGKVLAIDDDQGVLDTYRSILHTQVYESDALLALAGLHTPARSEGFVLATAQQGQAGLVLAEAALAEAAPFDVVFLDMRMPPGWDGLETARRLRQLDHGIYVVIVTAFTDRTVDEIQNALGHHTVLLRKPFTRDEIFQMARTLCQARRTDRDLATLNRELEQRVAQRTQALTESSERLRFLFERTGTAMLTLEADGLVSMANTRAVDMFGLEHASIEGQPFWQLVGAAHQSPLQDAAWLEDPENNFFGRECELPFTRKDGTVVWGLLDINPVPETGQTLIALIDISARKRAETALIESEARARLLLNSAGEGIFGLDPGGYCIFCNPAALSLLGLESAEAVLGQHLHALIHQNENSPAWMGCPIQQVLDSGQPVRVEHDLFWRVDNRQPFSVEYRAHPMLRDGRVIGVVVNFNDITAQRQAAEKLRQAAAVFESSREGIIISDLHNRILAVNQAFQRITGYGEAEVLGQNPSLLKSGRHDTVFYRTMWNAIIEHGGWSGEIWNRRRSGEIFPEWLSISVIRDDTGHISQFVAVFSDITQLKQSEAKLHHLAHHDPLTGLPNRLLLADRLEQAIHRAARQDSGFALLFLDLDRFKQVNDTLGHGIGDLLLQDVALRLRRLLRQQDTIARLGGDEFTILIEDLDDDQDAGTLANKVLLALREPFILAGQTLFIGASIGISLYPRDGTTSELLLQNADTAMYRAKNNGRGTYQFYDPEMTARVLERMTLDGELRRALDAGQFILHYQPQLDLASGAIVGFEALLRWNHPCRGLLLPVAFLDVAEETGLMVPIGEWALRQACQQRQAWCAAGLDAGVIAVNLSATQIQRGDLMTTLRQALMESGLPGSYLALEVSEHLLISEAEHLAELLCVTRELGINLVIGNFGLGPSSLSYLQRLPIHQIKLDRSFVHALPDSKNEAAIACAIIALGHSLCYQVLAEGVETPAQSDFLSAAGCDRVQGFHYGQPLTAAQAEQWLSQQAGRRSAGQSSNDSTNL